VEIFDAWQSSMGEYGVEHEQCTPTSILDSNSEDEPYLSSIRFLDGSAGESRNSLSIPSIQDECIVPSSSSGGN